MQQILFAFAFLHCGAEVRGVEMWGFFFGERGSAADVGTLNVFLVNTPFVWYDLLIWIFKFSLS